MFNKRKYNKEYNRLYRLRNRKRINEYKRRYRAKEKQNIQWVLTVKMAKKLSDAIRHQKKFRFLKAKEVIGCSFSEFKKHLESKFKEGMSWDNYGYRGWVIDHILPYKHFDLTDPKQRKKCFHYTNIQPLWNKENLAKGYKV